MIADTPRINRKFKDRLFRMVFQSKEDLLALYNAINNTVYTDTDDLEINTLEDAIYMGMKNDISFLVTDYLNLYEHQSTYNPNMPLRGLFYFADLYRKYVAVKKLNLYSSSLQKIPLPQYLVFYNGAKDEPDRQELLLSDAFAAPAGQSGSCLEVKVIMLNINLGHNRELMERCGRLKEYAQFISCVRDNMNSGLEQAEAVAQAVDSCIQSGILADLLAKHKAEVIDVVLNEYNEQEHMELERIEWEVKGEVKGKQADILLLLEDIGSIPDTIQTFIHEQKNPEILSRWLKLAAKSASFEEFEKEIRKDYKPPSVTP